MVILTLPAKIHSEHRRNYKPRCDIMYHGIRSRARDILGLGPELRQQSHPGDAGNIPGLGPWQHRTANLERLGIFHG